MFFYQQDLKVEWKLADMPTTTTKETDDRLAVIQEGLKQINNAWGELQGTSQLSNLIKNSKVEISLAEDGDFYVYENKNIGFTTKLLKSIFSSQPGDNLSFGDDKTLILLFNGKYNTYPLHVAMLIENDIQSCEVKNSSTLKINNINYQCTAGMIDEKALEYNINCYTIKNNWCFDIEYIISGLNNINVPSEIQIENILLNNLNFISPN